MLLLVWGLESGLPIWSPLTLEGEWEGWGETRVPSGLKVLAAHLSFSDPAWGGGRVPRYSSVGMEVWAGCAGLRFLRGVRLEESAVVCLPRLPLWPEREGFSGTLFSSVPLVFLDCKRAGVCHTPAC